MRSAVGTAAQVTDIQHQRRIVGSNLTAVELSGLTKVELGFALVLAVAASGLALGARLPGAPAHVRDRRARSARRARQLGGFVWGESLFVTAGGLVLGAAIAARASPRCSSRSSRACSTRRPTRSPCPWGYLGAVVALTVGAVGAAGAATLRALRRPAIEELREL